MEGPPLGPGGEDITWPDQVAPRGRKASSTRKVKPQTSNLKPETAVCSGTFILFKILGYTIVAVYSLIDLSLSRNPDNVTKLRV